MQILWLPSWQKTLAVPSARMPPTAVGFHYLKVGVKLGTQSGDVGIQQQDAEKKQIKQDEVNVL
jgi:hypothetical protein